MKQTVDRACGTIAMLNLVMNINNLELGELLNDVKVRSRDLPAPLRGDLIARQSPAIRAVHNSFSR
jgi:ubiquitin carboxyl-terminal hydrolase L5